MSKKRSANTEQGLSHDWMAPIDSASSCGADLEYDPEYVVLFAQVATKMDAQYGDFVGTAEPVNWGEVDRDCRRLMLRSKDIRLAVLFARCRTRLNAAAGLAEGLSLLAAWLTAFADSVHPQPDVDDDSNAALEIRMNALQALTDPSGLLADIRDIALARSCATRLQVRDVERAFAHPRPADALSVESVTRQLEDLRVQDPGLIAAFAKALEGLDLIDAWSRENLGAFAVDLSKPTRMLQCLVGNDPPAARKREMIETSDATAAEPEVVTADPALPVRPVSDIAASFARQPISDREAALQSIRGARHWFETHEPSSPIPVLLLRAEQFVGKRYAEALKAIPAEVLVEWGKHE